MLNIRVFSFYRGENALFSYFWFGGIRKLGEVYQICASHLGLDNKIKKCSKDMASFFKAIVVL